jgi:hypothetical protein
VDCAAHALRREPLGQLARELLPEHERAGQCALRVQLGQEAALCVDIEVLEV